MAYTTNAATNKVPAFGVPGTVTVGAEGSARTWDITSISVTPGNDLVEHRDANGMLVSRTHFNNDGATPAKNRSTTISISAIPVGANRAAAVTASAIVPNGTTFVVASSDVANGTWECTGMSVEGANTEDQTITLNGVWAVTNS